MACGMTCLHKHSDKVFLHTVAWYLKWFLLIFHFMLLQTGITRNEHDLWLFHSRIPFASNQAEKDDLSAKKTAIRVTTHQHQHIRTSSRKLLPTRWPTATTTAQHKKKIVVYSARSTIRQQTRNLLLTNDGQGDDDDYGKRDRADQLLALNWVSERTNYEHRALIWCAELSRKHDHPTAAGEISSRKGSISLTLRVSALMLFWGSLFAWEFMLFMLGLVQGMLSFASLPLPNDAFGLA